MKSLLFLLTVIFILLASNLYALPYATNVIDYNGNSLAPFNNPQLALGAPDFNLDAQPWGLYSIGQYGWITLELGEPVFDIEGPDLIVWEEGGGITDESADIFLSFDSNIWTLVGSVERGLLTCNIDIAGTGMSGSTYVKVVDTSGGSGGIEAKGFDLDAVTVVPEPASILLILGALPFIRRRKA